MMTETKHRKPISNSTGSTLGFKATNDGVDHINIYSRGKTELGRLLTHFAHMPFTHPYFGPFASMEGLWYFIRNGGNDESLRYLSGIRAKNLGRQSNPKWYPEFRQDILAANYQKIIQHDELRELIVASELPFDHYYLFGPNQIPVTPRDSKWLVDGFEDIRTALKKGEVPSCWTEAEPRYANKT